MRVWPGQPFPLGPWWDGEGTNFSLFSDAQGKPIKLVAKNHQFLGVQRAVTPWRRAS